MNPLISPKKGTEGTGKGTPPRSLVKPAPVLACSREGTEGTARVQPNVRARSCALAGASKKINFSINKKKDRSPRSLSAGSRASIGFEQGTGGRSLPVPSRSLRAGINFNPETPPRNQKGHFMNRIVFNECEENAVAAYAHQFIESWAAGGVDGLHAGPCAMADLHAAYVGWAHHNDEPAVGFDRFKKIANKRHDVFAKPEWLFDEQETCRIEVLVIKPDCGSNFPRGVRESLEQYRSRSAHVFAASVAAGGFSLEFQRIEDGE